MSTGVAKRVTISSEMEILATLVVNVNDSSKYRIEKSKQGFFLACRKEIHWSELIRNLD